MGLIRIWRWDEIFFFKKPIETFGFVQDIRGFKAQIWLKIYWKEDKRKDDKKNMKFEQFVIILKIY